MRMTKVCVNGCDQNDWELIYKDEPGAVRTVEVRTDTNTMWVNPPPKNGYHKGLL